MFFRNTIGGAQGGEQDDAAAERGWLVTRFTVSRKAWGRHTTFTV
jgi:hypothetical protein